MYCDNPVNSASYYLASVQHLTSLPSDMPPAWRAPYLALAARYTWTAHATLAHSTQKESAMLEMLTLTCQALSDFVGAELAPRTIKYFQRTLALADDRQLHNADGSQNLERYARGLSRLASAEKHLLNLLEYAEQKRRLGLV